MMAKTLNGGRESMCFGWLVFCSLSFWARRAGAWSASRGTTRGWSQPRLREDLLPKELLSAPRSRSILFARKTGLPTTAETETTGPEKKKKTRKKRKKKTDQLPPYWNEGSQQAELQMFETDGGLVDGPEGQAACRKARFKVKGNPLPLRRHRTSRGFVYNPSAEAQECFRAVVEKMVFHTNNQTTAAPQNMTVALVPPLFPDPMPLAMTIVFRTKRPKSHFVANDPSRPLKASAPSVCKPTRTDVDNLAKFVLDSLNGLLYTDDHQICSLCATKLLDNDTLCVGSTEVQLSVLSSANAEDVVQNSFQLYDL